LPRYRPKWLKLNSCNAARLFAIAFAHASQKAAAAILNASFLVTIWPRLLRQFGCASGAIAASAVHCGKRGPQATPKKESQTIERYY